MSFQQIFDEAMGETPPSGIDIDKVVRRQRRAAKVRPALATLAAAMVVAAGAATTIQLTAGDATPIVQDPADPLAGFPEYVDGGRVVAAVSASIADRSVALTFTPRTRDLILLTQCESDQPSSPDASSPDASSLAGGLYAELEVGDVSGRWPYCPVLGVLWDEWGDWGQFWDATGFEIGEPVTITVTLTEYRAVFGDGGELPMPEGTFGVAVAERVPFEDYRLPPAPEVLEPLPEAQPGDLAVVLRPDPADPEAPVEQTFTWSSTDASTCGEGVFPLELVSQTPGSLRVLLNGVEVAHHTWWDYGQVGISASLAPACAALAVGDEVTLAVEPRHVTGDWQVNINHAGG